MAEQKESRNPDSAPPKRELEPRRESYRPSARAESLGRREGAEPEIRAAPYLIEREIIELRRLVWRGRIAPQAAATSQQPPAAETPPSEREHELSEKYGRLKASDKDRQRKKGVIARIMGFIRSRR